MKDRIYYKIQKKYQHFRGIRLFRHTVDGVVQVVLSSGTESRRGRAAIALGINVITTITFFSNYVAGAYVEPCTEKEFKWAFRKVVKLLE